MKKLVHVLLLAAAVAASAAAQEKPAKVLRAVYFAPVHPDAALDKETEALVLGTPEMLATSIASLQPFTRADSADAARSVIAISTSPTGTGGLTMRIRLLEAGSTKSEASHEFTGAALNHESFRVFLGAAASRLAPLLGPVDPEADLLKVTSAVELIEPAKEDQLSRPAGQEAGVHPVDDRPSSNAGQHGRGQFRQFLLQPGHTPPDR